MEWRYKIKIKEYFEDETTPELIAKLSNILIIRLKGILKDIEKTDVIDTDLYFLCDEVERHIDNFEFLYKLATEVIPKSEWKNYSFNGDFENEFNGYLDELYDTGDELVILKNGKKQKLIWIG